MTHRPVRALCIVLAVLLGAGCAAQRPVPADREAAGQALRAELRAFHAWRAEGRLVVRTRDDGGQAGFTWIERPDGGFRLRLAGPWGQGAARLQGGRGRAELVTGDGYRYTGPDARALLAGVYGWEIPVNGLRRWLLGLPDADADFTLDRFGRLATLDWHEWHVEYRRYRRVDGLDLPAVLMATARGGQTEVRVAIDSWRLGTGQDQEAPVPDSPVPLMGG